MQHSRKIAERFVRHWVALGGQRYDERLHANGFVKNFDKETGVYHDPEFCLDCQLAKFLDEQIIVEDGAIHVRL